MSQLLHKKGSFEILASDVGSLNPSDMNRLIWEAGTTSHQSKGTSEKTPEEFIAMLRRLQHYSVLEHSWFTFKITHRAPFEVIASRLYEANNLFCITNRGNDCLISGNARMFVEGYANASDCFTKGIIGYLLQELSRENPVLFPEPKEGFKLCSPPTAVERNPDLWFKKELLVHKAMMVRFNNVSRGFTHEDVRSRNGIKQVVAYTQESTRYVDYSQTPLQFVLPYKNFDWDKPIEFTSHDIKYTFSPAQFVDLLEDWYKALRREGLEPEEARQWLPIGIKSQIVQTFNLNEWRHWFKIRTSPTAHPEIRYVAVRLLETTKKLFPEVFNDFVIAEDKESARFVGTDFL